MNQKVFCIVVNRQNERNNMGVLLGIFSWLTLIIAVVLLNAHGEKTKTSRIAVVIVGFLAVNVCAYVLAVPVLH